MIKNDYQSLPKGYASIPVTKDQEKALLKICIVVKTEPDPVGGHLVMVRDTIDAKVFLGCVVDGSGQVHEWLELWVQNTEITPNTPVLYRQTLSNALLDARWNYQIRAFEKLDEAQIIKTGWECTNPLPIFIDLSTLSPVHPVDANSGASWQLCKDESLLQQKKLPGYNGSLYRYLYLPESGPESRFVPVTSDAPTNESTIPLSDICGNINSLIPFNKTSGMMLAKKHLPIGLESIIDILSGASWDGLKHGKSVLELGSQIAALSGDEHTLAGKGRLFLDTHGKKGRLLETFHLKLRLFADIVSSVHAMVYSLQQPLLNLSTDSFQVNLGQPGQGLPFLWTATAKLNKPGCAIPFAIEKSDLNCYLHPMTGQTSIFRPIDTTLPAKGLASVRIRQMLSNSNNTITVEGTFATQERIEITANDLVWLRLNLASGGIDLYAHLEQNSAMAIGEWRFRTVAHHTKDSEIHDLRSAEGVPIPETPFEIMPLLSSPCDLYSLAILGIRILLVDNTTSLPVAVDEVLSLIRQVETNYDPAKDLTAQIASVFNADIRWPKSLGPHHLTLDEMTHDEAFGTFPPELWRLTLSMILRMFPGPSPISICRDYGDAQQGGLHKVFEQTIADLDNLLLKSRSLIVPNLEFNREIVAVIQKYLKS